MPRSRVFIVAVLVALAAAGCGVGAGEQAGGTKLVVTDGFGRASIADLPDPQVGGSDTVMRLLQRNVGKVQTKYGGGFVSSIEGKGGGTPGGRPVDWFFYVNGILADKGAASTKVRENDTVWWDRHDWGGGETKAVVGAFPEPFAHGVDGRKLPVRVECIESSSPACNATQKALTRLGIVAAKGGLQTSFTQDTLRIIVGRYDQIRADDAVRTLEKGPRISGVYAQTTGDGKQIRLLDAKGGVTRTVGAGSGLVAALVYEDGRPVWVVTGTDDAGVQTAAGALDEGTLKNRFALVVTDGRSMAVPTP